MSRSGYPDDCDSNWQMIKWRGMVVSAMRGKRGQQFFRDLLAALDAMAEKSLIAGELEDAEGAPCNRQSRTCARRGHVQTRPE